MFVFCVGEKGEKGKNDNWNFWIGFLFGPKMAVS